MIGKSRDPHKYIIVAIHTNHNGYCYFYELLNVPESAIEP